jgi:hypothetical protein
MKYYVKSLDFKRVVDADDPTDAVIRSLILEAYRDFDIGETFQVSECGFESKDFVEIDALPFMNRFAEAIEHFQLETA